MLADSLAEPIAWNARRISVEQKRQTVRFGVKWLNYVTEGGRWACINSQFAGKLHDTSCWRVALPSLATGKVQLVSAPIYSPQYRCQHRRTHNGFSLRPLNVSPTCADTRSPHEVVYRDAYGAGLHLVYRVRHGRAIEFQKLIRIDAVAAHNLAMDFTYEIECPRDTILRPTGFQFDADDELAGFGVRPAKAWDQYGNKVAVPITVVAAGRDRFRITKHVTAGLLSGLRGTVELDLTFTAYPEAGASTGTTVDGVCNRTGVEATWSGLRNGAGTGHQDTSVSGVGVAIVGQSSPSTQYMQLHRMIATFDTNLGSFVSHNVTAATFSWYGLSKTDGLSISPEIIAVETSPNADDDLVNSDFSATDFVPRSSAITFANFDTTGYNDFVLTDPAGLSIIDLNGISRLGLIENRYDLADATPTISGFINLSSFNGYFADNDGFDKDPKLVVSYSVGDADLPTDETGRAWWPFMGAI